MYHMKNIVNHNEEIMLPKCMYHIKNPNDSLDEFDKISINISNQVPSTKMAELEQRQEQLIRKLDFLYDRIKTISSFCNTTSNADKSGGACGSAKTAVLNPEEVVLVCNPDNLPFYIYKIIKDSSASVNICWHIHSSVPNEKVAKINGFVKGFKNIDKTSKINLRLIFKCVSADSELKLSSVSVPIVGTVNILRYLSLAYPTIVPYDGTDFKQDYLLDICHVLERTAEKSKEPLFKKLFSESNIWVYKNNFTIVDLAAYNIVKQSKNTIKYVPKVWYDKCEQEII